MVTLSPYLHDDDRSADEKNSRSSSAKPLPALPPNQGPPSISLVELISFAVHKTYQDLTVLVELLPKRDDTNRKISIVQFAHTTRQLYIRLLAVVKWLKAYGKVHEKCVAITYFLEQQASYFVDTADSLFRLAREDLANARLPAFQIPAAVDVLTLGAYPRLPLCIKDRFVSEASITEKERACVLQRLNQVITYRLYSTARPLPRRIRQVEIRNGMAVLRVPGEFEASLTILGELPTTPWTLLHIKNLIEDHGVGDGNQLVHPLQLNYLHQLVQRRMNDSDWPIHEVYTVMHVFCLSLRLDVLYCQAMTLTHGRLKGHVSIDAYDSRQRRLVISYWRQTTGALAPSTSSAKLSATSTKTSPTIAYQLVIETDDNGLRCRHVPASFSSRDRLPEIQQESISVESLITETCTVRCRQRLSMLSSELERLTGAAPSLSGATAPILTVPLGAESQPEETLNITVNVFSGCFLLEVGVLDASNVIIKEGQKALSEGLWSTLPAILQKLKIQVIMARYKKTTAPLPVYLVDTVPLASNHYLMKILPRDRIYLQFARYDQFYLILSFRLGARAAVYVDYYLLSNSAAAVHLFPKEDTSQTPATVVQQPTVPKATTVIQLDPAHLYRSHSGVLNDWKHAKRSVGEKWKALDHDLTEEPGNKSRKFADEVAATISVCEERIPFLLLADEFTRKGVRYQSCHLEGTVGNMVLSIIRFNSLSNGVDDESLRASTLWQQNISCNMRLHHVFDKVGDHLIWAGEFLLADPPLIGCDQKDDETKSHTLMFTTSVNQNSTSQCVELFLNLICSISHLYQCVVEFAPVYKAKMRDYIQIKKYSYHKLVLGYGPEFIFIAIVQWRFETRAFHISFGVQGTRLIGCNPHTVMTQKLVAKFNQTRDLAWLAQTLHDTAQPLLALRQLKDDLVMPVEADMPPTVPKEAGAGSHKDTGSGVNMRFCCIPLSECCARLIFRSRIVIEVIFLADELLAVRDCAAALTSERAPQVAQLVPIPGLKRFLLKFDGDKEFGVNKTPAKSASDTDVKPISDAWLTSPVPPASVGTVQGVDVAPSPAAAPLGGLDPMTPSPAPPLSNAPLMTPSPAPGTAAMGVASPAVVVQSAQSSSALQQEVAQHDLQFKTTAKPILLSHAAFWKVCRRTEFAVLAPLENYLCSVLVLRGLKQAVALMMKDCIQNFCAGASTLRFSLRGLDIEFSLDPENYHLKLNIKSSGEILGVEEVRLAERYFRERVAPLHSVAGISTFLRMINPLNHPNSTGVVKSFTSLMRHELEPENDIAWNARVCLVAPPNHLTLNPPNAMQPQAPIQSAAPAIKYNKKQEQMLFFLKLTSVNESNGGRQLPILPLIFDFKSNVISLQPNAPNTYPHPQVNKLLERQSQRCKNLDCCIWPAVRDLVQNLERPM